MRPISCPKASIYILYNYISIKLFSHFEFLLRSFFFLPVLFIHIIFSFSASGFVSISYTHNWSKFNFKFWRRRRRSRKQKNCERHMRIWVLHRCDNEVRERKRKADHLCPANCGNLYDSIIIKGQRNEEK